MFQDLRWWLMLLSLLLFAVVFAVMLVSIWRHHRTGSEAAQNYHVSLLVELCWALAPILIVVMLVWPAARVWLAL